MIVPPDNEVPNHSDEYYKAIQEYEEKLDIQGLPIIFSLKHFAIWIGISHSYLNKLIKTREDQYNNFSIQKKSGGYREIKSPTLGLKSIQRFIYSNILNSIKLDQSCYGFRKKVSIKDNASLHINQEAILRIDLYRFFDSITEKRVYGLFLSLGYHPNLSVSFAQLLTAPHTSAYEHTLKKENVFPKSYYDVNKAVLPQGAPTSPSIANIIAKKLDVRLRNLAYSFEIKYSRYADDLIFSGKKENIPPIHLLKKIIIEEGFFMNYNKINLQIGGNRRIVTGLVVTDKVSVKKDLKREIRKHIHYCKKNGVLKQLEWLKKNDDLHISKFSDRNITAYKEWLLGNIIFVRSIERELGEKYLFDFQDIDWPL